MCVCVCVCVRVCMCVRACVCKYVHTRLVLHITSPSLDVPEDPHPIRLIGGRNSSEGRVEIYYDGQWGTICDNKWDINDATVVCNSLGFPGAASAPIGVGVYVGV